MKMHGMLCSGLQICPGCQKWHGMFCPMMFCPVSRLNNFLGFINSRTRRMAENGFAPPPLGNFADISYLVDN